VHVTTRTVIENLLVGMLLVTLVLWAFLARRERGDRAVNIRCASSPHSAG